MKQHRAIANVKNVHGRHALLLLVLPLVALVCVVFFIISFCTSTAAAFRSFINEFRYDFYQLKNTVTTGIVLNWMGREAYELRVKSDKAEKVKRLLNRA